MSDMSVSSSARENAKQLEDLKQEHEQKLSKLRAEQKKEMEQVRSSGDAAVNHLRKSTDERVETARSQSTAKLQREDDALAKTYKSLKQRQAQQIETLSLNIAESEERADSTIRANQKREMKVVEDSQGKLKEFLAAQKELKDKAQKNTNAELREMQQNSNFERKKTINEANAKMRELEMNNKLKREELHTQSRQNYEEAKSQATRRLSELHQEHELKLQRERSRASDEYNRVRIKTRDEIASEQSKGEKALKAQAQDSQRQLENDRMRALKTNEKMQKQYSVESQRIEADGTRDIETRKNKFAQAKLDQQRDQKSQLQQLDHELHAREDQIRDEHENRIDRTVAALDKELKNQQTQFQEKYKKDGDTFKSTLNNQKEIFLKEQYKQNSAQQAKAELAEKRSDDPFYTPKSFDAKLTETESAYELTAKVPAHEKDNVTVRVKNGRVVLSAARMHEQSFEDKGVKASTNSQQTFRQEFKLDRPADAKHAITQIKEDGSIRAVIPKKGFGRV